MKLLSLIGPVSVGGVASEGEPYEITGEGADYGTAKDNLESKVPNGWQLLGIRQESPLHVDD